MHSDNDEVLEVVNNLNDDIYEALGDEFVDLVGFFAEINEFIWIINYKGTAICSSEDIELVQDPLTLKYEPLEPVVRRLVSDFFTNMGKIDWLKTQK